MGFKSWYPYSQTNIVTQLSERRLLAWKRTEFHQFNSKFRHRPIHT